LALGSSAGKPHQEGREEMAKELLVTATGRRKESIARVRLKPGTGEFEVNERTLDQYFGRATSKMVLKQPLEVVEQLGKVDISINVCGGGSRARPAPSATASAAR
jgi:ribosomal protein S9